MTHIIRFYMSLCIAFSLTQPVTAGPLRGVYRLLTWPLRKPIIGLPVGGFIFGPIFAHTIFKETSEASQQSISAPTTTTTTETKEASAANKNPTSTPTTTTTTETNTAKIAQQISTWQKIKNDYARNWETMKNCVSGKLTEDQKKQLLVAQEKSAATAAILAARLNTWAEKKATAFDTWLEENKPNEE